MSAAMRRYRQETAAERWGIYWAIILGGMIQLLELWANVHKTCHAVNLSFVLLLLCLV